MLVQDYTIYFYHGATTLVGQGVLIIEESWSDSDTTLYRTHLDEWSDRRRGLYLTTHNAHKRQTFGIRTHNPNKRTAAEPCLRTRGHWGRQIIPLFSVILKESDVAMSTPWMEVRGLAPLILNLGTGCRQVVSFTPGLHYSREGNTSLDWTRSCVGPTADMEGFGEEIIPFPCRRSHTVTLYLESV